MAITNTWCCVGVVNQEPKLMKLSDDKVMARTVLAIEPNNNSEKIAYIPVTAFNKKAHVLCALAHRGSKILAKGSIFTTTTVTSQQGKTLIGVSFKLTDFEILIKEPIDVGEQDFSDTVEMYDPEAFMEEE